MWKIDNFNNKEPYLKYNYFTIMSTLDGKEYWTTKTNYIKLRAGST